MEKPYPSAFSNGQNQRFHNNEITNAGGNVTVIKVFVEQANSSPAEDFFDNRVVNGPVSSRVQPPLPLAGDSSSIAALPIPYENLLPDIRLLQEAEDWSDGETWGSNGRTASVAAGPFLTVGNQQGAQPPSSRQHSKNPFARFLQSSRPFDDWDSLTNSIRKDKGKHRSIPTFEGDQAFRDPPNQHFELDNHKIFEGSSNRPLILNPPPKLSLDLGDLSLNPNEGFAPELDAPLSNNEQHHGVEIFSTQELDLKPLLSATKFNGSCQIYIRQMLPEGHGFPLWSPQPDSCLPETSQQDGISIGDVGIITSSGGFQFLFNIWASQPDVDELSETSSEGESGLLPEKFIVRQNDIFGEGDSISKGAAATAVRSGDNSKINHFLFRCFADEGAILALPTGAVLEEMSDETILEAFIINNAKRWYQYARTVANIRSASLYLVTGCIKADTWGIATYGRKLPEAYSTLKLANIGTLGGLPDYFWEDKSESLARRGPSRNAFKNQCLYLRGFKIAMSHNALAEMDTVQLKARAPGSSSKPHINGNTFAVSGSSSVNKAGSDRDYGHREASTSGGNILSNGLNHTLHPKSNADVKLEAFPYGSVETSHPSDHINNMLLEEVPDAMIAVTHDNQWRSILKNFAGSGIMGKSELLAHIRGTFVNVASNGVVLLRRRHDIDEDGISEPEGDDFLANKSPSLPYPNPLRGPHRFPFTQKVLFRARWGLTPMALRKKIGQLKSKLPWWLSLPTVLGLRSQSLSPSSSRDFSIYRQSFTSDIIADFTTLPGPDSPYPGFLDLYPKGESSLELPLGPDATHTASILSTVENVVSAASVLEENISIIPPYGDLELDSSSEVVRVGLIDQMISQLEDQTSMTISQPIFERDRSIVATTCGDPGPLPQKSSKPKVQTFDTPLPPWAGTKLNGAYQYLCHVGEAQQWIEGCFHEQLSIDVVEMAEGLRNGVVLAKLVQFFEGDAEVRRIYQAPKHHFRHSENINIFLNFVREEGLPEAFIFELTDLYDKKNIPKVIYCIHALSHLLARRGRAERIGTLLGQLHFTEDELQKTQRRLNEAGEDMPDFGNVERDLAAWISAESEFDF